MSISPTCLGKAGRNCSRGNGKAYQGGMFETQGFILCCIQLHGRNAMTVPLVVSGSKSGKALHRALQ